MTKMKENTKAYDKAAANLALSLVTIKQCKSCGYPVIDGYVCSFCYECNPTSSHQEVSCIEI